MPLTGRARKIRPSPASSPSGKARVCKTLPAGSIPADASVLERPLTLVPARAFAPRWWTPPAEMLARVHQGMRVKVRAAEIDPDGVANLFMSRPIWVSVDGRDGDTI